MSNRCEVESPLIENLYAFLGWVVAYSDYGKELAVDTVLNRFRLIDKVDEQRAFKSADEFDKYEMFLEKYRTNEIHIKELEVELTEDEKGRCDELIPGFTPRFRRAKLFTNEQLIEYKAKKVFFKEEYKSNMKINPVKLVDHETKKVACVFPSGTVAAKVFRAGIRNINSAVANRSFYKGYVWMSCDKETYMKYEEILKNNNVEKCRKCIV